MTYLLDTSVAIELRERNALIASRVAEAGRLPSLSLLTLVELEGGIVGTDEVKARRRASVTLLQDASRVLPFDLHVVRAYARILESIGFSRRRVIDRLIGATAIVHDLTLVTTNGADFWDIPGLKLEVWPAPAQ